MNNKVYRYSPDTGELLGVASLQENWKEPGTYLQLPNSTPLAPPEIAKYEIAVFDGEKWAIQPDYRGVQYWLADGSVQTGEQIGPLPQGGTLTPPLDKLRAAALALLPDWEAAERAVGLDHANHHWRTSPDALQDIRDALLADMVPGGVWIDAAGNVVPMSVAQLQALWAVCVGRGAAIYQRRLQMAAAIATMEREQLEHFAPAWA